MAAIRIEIPDEASRLDVDRTDLPSDLIGEEAQVRCRQLGDGWLTARQHLIATIPSIIVPQERNVLINPAHPLMIDVKIVSTERFRFDPRLATSKA
jgi:hypothetical protein